MCLKKSLLLSKPSISKQIKNLQLFVLPNETEAEGHAWGYQRPPWLLHVLSKQEIHYRFSKSPQPNNIFSHLIIIKRKHTFVICTPVELVIMENSSINCSDPDVISSVAIAPILSSRLRIAVSTTPKINAGIPKNSKRRTYFSLLLLLLPYSFSWPW